jgi:hypothetical protein
MAAHLRRNEIAQLRRDDLHLVGAKPYILFQSETVKNRRGKPHKLHPELATDLAPYLGESNPGVGVFALLNLLVVAQHGCCRRPFDGYLFNDVGGQAN